MASSPSDLPNHPDGGYISATLKIHGDISGDADLYVDGVIEGVVSLGERKLTVGDRGRVAASVQVGEATVRGRVEGDVRAVDRVEVASTGDVDGEIHARRLAVADGARIRGKVYVGAPATKPAAAPVSAPASAEKKGPQAVQPGPAAKTKTG
jgi:cytoskeletal protein CcmA (bactofilin family)